MTFRDGLGHKFAYKRKSLARHIRRHTKQKVKLHSVKEFESQLNEFLELNLNMVVASERDFRQLEVHLLLAVTKQRATTSGL